VLLFVSAAQAAEITVPKDTDVVLAFDQSLSSKTAKPGERVSLHVKDNVVVNGAIGGVGASTSAPGIQETIYKAFNFPTANDDAQDNLEGIRNTPLGPQDGRGITTSNIDFADNNVVAARALSYGASSFPNNTGWTMTWITSFTPDESGQWGFRFNSVDDDASFWIDLTGTPGVFDLSDRFYNRGCCGGSGDQFTPAGTPLVAGTTYLLGIAARDFNGGNFQNMQFKSPTAAGVTAGNWVTINAGNYPTIFKTQTIANNAVVKKRHRDRDAGGQQYLQRRDDHQRRNVGGC